MCLRFIRPLLQAPWVRAAGCWILGDRISCDVRVYELFSRHVLPVLKDMVFKSLADSR
jgi:hypothetical protein